MLSSSKSLLSQCVAIAGSKTALLGMLLATNDVNVLADRLEQLAKKIRPKNGRAKLWSELGNHPNRTQLHIVSHISPPAGVVSTLIFQYLNVNELIWAQLVCKNWLEHVARYLRANHRCPIRGTTLRLQGPTRLRLFHLEDVDSPDWLIQYPEYVEITRASTRLYFRLFVPDVVLVSVSLLLHDEPVWSLQTAWRQKTWLEGVPSTDNRLQEINLFHFVDVWRKKKYCKHTGELRIKVDNGKGYAQIVSFRVLIPSSSSASRHLQKKSKLK